MKSIISTGLGALGALLLTALSSSADDGKNAIKGGVGIGPYQLGADITEVEKLFDKTVSTVNTLGPGARVLFEKSAAGKEEETIISIRRGDDGQHYFVSQVAATSPDYRTPAGNSTASDLAAIWREFPDLAKYDIGEAFDGTMMVIYCSRASGVSVLVERPPGTPVTTKPEPGMPTGKCRAFIVQKVGEDGRFEPLGVRPKKSDAD